MDFIPVYQPDLSGNEKKYVNECLDSTWISSKGRFVSDFEESFASKIGSKYAISVSNGTVALHLALVSLGIGPGDEVIVPTFTYIASVNAITYTGATPIFVDSEYESWQIDPNDVQAKITSKTKAIMAVHLYGQPCNMAALREIAESNSIFLVEDCAEALGSKFQGEHVGTFGDMSTFSFFGNKTITTGEGGMVVTDDKTFYERAVHFRGQGLAKHRQYWHDVVGYNYRMTNICAAIGLAQLERFEEILIEKRRLAEFYKQKLSGLPVSLHQEVGDVVHSFWMISLLTRSPNEREQLMEFLRGENVETRPTFYPVHTMPMYSQNFQKFPVAEDLGWRGLNLPSWPKLSEEKRVYICEAITRFYEKR